MGHLQIKRGYGRPPKGTLIDGELGYNTETKELYIGIQQSGLKVVNGYIDTTSNSTLVPKIDDSMKKFVTEKIISFSGSEQYIYIKNNSSDTVTITLIGYSKSTDQVGSFTLGNYYNNNGDLTNNITVAGNSDLKLYLISKNSSNNRIYLDTHTSGRTYTYYFRVNFEYGEAQSGIPITIDFNSTPDETSDPFVVLNADVGDTAEVTVTNSIDELNVSFYSINPVIKTLATNLYLLSFSFSGTVNEFGSGSGSFNISVTKEGFPYKTNRAVIFNSTKSDHTELIEPITGSNSYLVRCTCSRKSYETDRGEFGGSVMMIFYQGT